MIYLLPIFLFLTGLGSVAAALITFFIFTYRILINYKYANSLEILSVILLLSCFKQETNDLANMILAIISDTTILLAVILCLIKGTKHYSQNILLILSILFSLIVITKSSSSLLHFIFIFREYSFPLITVIFLSRSIRSSSSAFILISLFFTYWVLVNYFFGDKYKLVVDLNDGWTYAYRSFAGIDIPRLNIPLPVSTGGSGMISVLLAYFIINNGFKDRSLLSARFAALGYLLMAIFTLSLGALITMMLVILLSKAINIWIKVISGFVALNYVFIFFRIGTLTASGLLMHYFELLQWKLSLYSTQGYLLGGDFDVQSSAIKAVRVSYRDIGLFRGFLALGIIPMILILLWHLIEIFSANRKYLPLLVAPLFYLHGLLYANMTLMLLISIALTKDDTYS